MNVCSQICFPECTTVFREEMISNNTSRKLHSEINKLVSRLQRSEWPQDAKDTNYEGCYKLIAAMTYGSLEATIDTLMSKVLLTDSPLQKR